MSNSESQNKKGKGGRKPKFDYTSEDFLLIVKSYAKKGFTDKEIAHAVGILPQTFCEKKSRYPELSEVLSRARCALNSLVRAKFLAMALGDSYFFFTIFLLCMVVLKYINDFSIFSFYNRFRLMIFSFIYNV